MKQKTLRRVAASIAAAPILMASMTGCSVADTLGESVAQEPTVEASSISHDVTRESLSLSRNSLDQVKVRPIDPASEREAQSGYDSAKFKYPGDAKASDGWPSEVQNCNVRWATLYLDADNPEWDDQSSCSIGADVTWTDPYGVLKNGKVTYKHSGDPSDFDIDHIVARKDMWISGANKKPAEDLAKMGNDPTNLTISDLSANRSKGDSSPHDYMPPGNFRCEYAQRYIDVKYTYGLSMLQSDMDRLNKTLDTCLEAVK